ncbi:hypothetical protein ACLKMH_13615 [Psychromonas sp. KJ10-10]|uniref:hypothetical protein n=1 Tax=Psychromonas sp. KJ10-10 TaxID=3391823 RepID=UPI0039B6678C
MGGLFRLIKLLAKCLNATRLIIINIIFFAILAIIIFAFNSEEVEVQIADNSILQLNFNGVIVEQKQPIDFSGQLSKQLLSDEQQLTEYPIEEVLQVILATKNDTNIDKILLDLILGYKPLA